MTLVVDASAVAEILLGTSRGAKAAGELGDHVLIAPSHLDVEVVSVIRGWTLGRRISDERALIALEESGELGIETVSLGDNLAGVFALRHNVSTYDAMYVVLARATGCRLLTLDARLAAAVPDCAYVPDGI